MGQPIAVSVVAGVVIRQDGKFLLVQEAQQKAYGLWNWPAGKVDEGYTTEETAVKEAKEESGYDVELVRQVAIWHGQARHPVKHLFEARIIGGELRWPKGEILDAKWFSADEIRNMKEKLRDEWVFEGVEMYEQGK